MIQEEADPFQESKPSKKSKFTQRDDSAWQEKAARWREIKETIKKLEEEEKLLREELIELADNQSSEGGGIRASLCTRKGSIDYKAIPILQGVDLEAYRKSPTQVWYFKAL